MVNGPYAYSPVFKKGPGRKKGELAMRALDRLRLDCEIYKDTARQLTSNAITMIFQWRKMKLHGEDTQGIVMKIVNLEHKAARAIGKAIRIEKQLAEVQK